ncbi:DUF1579 domain-containing protein [bacterium]|jgi:hypothetical protein|nr:DUF1579 domain-containing protein [bacterium]
MMARNAWTIGAMILIMCSAMQADEPSAEWKVLEPLLGRWEGDFSVGTSPKARTRSNNEWVLDRRFIRSTIESIDAQGNSFQTIVMWGFDPASKQYTRSFFFSSGGSFHEKGGFDPVTKTFSFSDPDLKTGQVRVASIRLADADTLRWQIIFPAAAGQQPLIATGSNTRVKNP